jgi:hypothetical protein
VSDLVLLFLHESAPSLGAAHHRIAADVGWRPLVAGWRDVEVRRGGVVLRRALEVRPDGRVRPLRSGGTVVPAAVMHRTWVRGGLARLIAAIAAECPDALISHHRVWPGLADKRASEQAFRRGEIAGLHVPRPVTLLPTPGRLERDLAAEAALRPLIIKPAGGTMCWGILLSTPGSFPAVAARTRRSRRYVAQDLVLDSTRWRGRKVDLRVYSLVTSLRPLRARVYRPGVVRIAGARADRRRPAEPARALTGNSFRKREGLPRTNLRLGRSAGPELWQSIDEVCHRAFACYARTDAVGRAIDLERRFCLVGLDLLPMGDGVLFLEINPYPQLNGWGAAADRGLLSMHRAWLGDLLALHAGRDGVVTSA